MLRIVHRGPNPMGRRIDGISSGAYPGSGFMLKRLYERDLLKFIQRTRSLYKRRDMNDTPPTFLSVKWPFGTFILRLWAPHKAYEVFGVTVFCPNRCPLYRTCPYLEREDGKVASRGVVVVVDHVENEIRIGSSPFCPSCCQRNVFFSVPFRYYGGIAAAIKD